MKSGSNTTFTRLPMGLGMEVSSAILFALVFLDLD
jgi:hypothetical protein